MFDDMISTAGSISGAARLLHSMSVREIHVAITHPVFCGGAIKNLAHANLASIVFTDTNPVRPDQMLPNMVPLTVAPLLGEAIKRIHRNESVSRLFR
jgi:ribose-phosphate pyrophosphokinase